MRKLLLLIGFLSLFMFGNARGVIYLDDCDHLGVPETYILTKDIYVTATNPAICMRLVGINLILDCQGHSITANESSPMIRCINSIPTWEYYNVTVKNCVLIDCHTGIGIQGTNDTVLINNSLVSNYEGIRISGNTHNALIKDNVFDSNHYGGWLLDIRNSSFIGNTFLNGWGLRFDYGYGNKIINNLFNNELYGIGWGITGSQGNLISDNVFHYLTNGEAIALFYDNNTVTNNIIDSAYNGMGMSSQSHNNIIINNTIINSGQIGLYFNDGSSNNTVISNIITNSTLSGIYMRVNVSGNLIYNNFLNNSANYLFTPYSNYWNTTKTLGTNIIGESYIGGNYWGSPNGDGYSDTCADADYDGFCDDPYVLNSDNIDYLPLTRIPECCPQRRIGGGGSGSTPSLIELYPGETSETYYMTTGVGGRCISFDFEGTCYMDDDSDVPNDWVTWITPLPYYLTVDACYSTEMIWNYTEIYYQITVPEGTLPGDYSAKLRCTDILGSSGPNPIVRVLLLDSDNDGVPDDEDKCPNTIGEQLIYGCSCEQILELKPGEDSGECSKGIIEVFTKAVGWAKDLFG